MNDALSFVRFALSHADRCSIPNDAVSIFPCSLNEIGTDVWASIHHTRGEIITPELLDERFNNHYAPRGWSKEAYNVATAQLIGCHAVDCCGLLNCYLGTEVTAQTCFFDWCDPHRRGQICDLPWSWEIGEAVFYKNVSGSMRHMGIICGHTSDGEPLVVESRGIRFGVVITKLSERPWTHRGLINRRLQYTSCEYEETDIELATMEELYALFSCN